MSGPDISPNSSVGARPIASPARKRPVWLLALLGLLVLLVLIVLLVLLSRCGGDDDSTSASASSAGSTTAAGAAATPTASADAMASATMSGAPVPSASDGASAEASSAAATTAGGDTADGVGTITTGQTDGRANDPGALLPLANATEIGANGNLSAYTGTMATATSARVQSVPADEGFWVGSGHNDRVWIQLTGGAGESPFTVKKGDAVSFISKVVKNTTGYAKTAGVAGDEGRAMLTAQGQHITVARSALTLSK